MNNIKMEIDFAAIAWHRHTKTDVKKFLKAVRAKFPDKDVKELRQGFKVVTNDEKLHIYSLNSGCWYLSESGARTEGK